MKINDKVKVTSVGTRFNDGFVGLEGVVKALHPTRSLDVEITINMIGSSVMRGPRDFCFKSSELVVLV